GGKFRQSPRDGGAGTHGRPTMTNHHPCRGLGGARPAFIAILLLSWSCSATGALAFCGNPSAHAQRPVVRGSANAPTCTPARAPGDSVFGYGTNNPTCAQWTDGCVVCTRNGCSNPGIACQPKEISCSTGSVEPDRAR